MAEKEGLTCEGCGQPLAAVERTKGWCSTCNLNSTRSRSKSLASTIDAVGQRPVAQDADSIVIEDYDLIRPIGRGGMGMVYLARQLSADRLVALKVILSERLVELASNRREQAIERFINESRAAARLHHENIVTVFDIGESHGRHYYAMQYVDGDSLSMMLRDGPLENRVAAHYLEAIARAVHVAHQAGVLHRDLKPSNVIVERVNDRPLVADFGLAKMLASDSDMTMTGEVFGSPGYMPPEQARSAGDVTELADVYSLGATLYHLLTGRPPFQAASFLETLKQVIDEEPISPREVNPAVDIDLETITLKCLDKEPSRRYLSAQQLSEDLSAYLEGRTISARPASTWDHLSRWGRRNPAIAAWILVATALLIIGTATSTTFALLERQQRTQAVRNAGLAESKSKLAQEKEKQATALSQQLASSLAKVEQQSNQAKRDAFISSLSASFAYLQNAEPQRIGNRLARLKLTDKEVGQAGFAFNYLNRRAHIKPQIIAAHTASAQAVAISPDDQVIASGGEDFIIELWDANTGQHLRSLQAASYPVTVLAFSVDGKYLAAGMRNTERGNHQTRVDIWDYENGELVVSLPHHCSVESIRFSNNRKLMVTATAGVNELGEIRVYRLNDWEFVRKLAGHKPGVKNHPWGVADLDLHWDSKQLVSAGYDGKSKLWDIETGKELKTFSGHSGWVRSVAFDSVGKTIVSGSDDQSIRFWNVADAQQTRIFRDGVGVTTGVDFDNGFRNLIAISDLGLMNWDLTLSQASALGGKRWLNDFAFSSDGSNLVTATQSGDVEIWNYDDSHNSMRLSHQGYVNSIAFSEDGRKLATGSGKKSVFVYDLESRKQILEIPKLRALVADVVFSHDAKYLSSRFPPEPQTGRTHCSLWNAETGESLDTLVDNEKRGIENLVFANNSPLVAIEKHKYSRDGSGQLEIWNLDDQEQVSLVTATDPDNGLFDTIFFSSDDKRLYASEGYNLETRDVASGELLSSVEIGRAVGGLRVSPEKHLLLARTLVMVDTITGESSNIGDLDAGARLLAASRDGRWLAWSDYRDPQEMIRVWDCVEKRGHGVVDSHQQRVVDAAFTDQGTLITCSRDATIRFWDVAGKQDLGVLTDHALPVFAVALSPDQRWLASGGGDTLRGIGSGKPGELFLWNATPVQPVQAKDGSLDSTAPTTPKEISRIENVDLGAEDWSYSADGRILVIAHRFPRAPDGESTPGFVDTWDLETGREIKTARPFENLKNPFKRVSNLCLSKDGSHLAVTEQVQRVLRRFIVKDGKEVEVPPPPPDPQRVMAYKLGHDDPGVLFNVDFEEARVIRFSSDANAVVVAGSDGNYEYRDLKLAGRIILKGKVNLKTICSADISPDGKWLALGGEVNEAAEISEHSEQQRLVIVDLRDGSEFRWLGGHEAPVTDVRFSNSGAYLAASDALESAFDSYEISRKLIVRQTANWKVLSHLPIERETKARISFSPDDEFLVAGGRHNGHVLHELNSDRWRFWTESDNMIRRIGVTVSNGGTMRLLNWTDEKLSCSEIKNRPTGFNN